MLSMTVMAGCVSRYRPLNHIHPLSGKCDDFERFSEAILKHRDQGFTKRATTNFTVLYVDNEKKRQQLLEKYRPIIEIVYAEYLINAAGIRATARATCEHQLLTAWPALANEDYRSVADTAYQCQLANLAETDIRRCVLARARGIHDPELERPPE
jgi:hypothetical protein